VRRLSKMLLFRRKNEPPHGRVAQIKRERNSVNKTYK
jgi:hypothetical protein